MFHACLQPAMFYELHSGPLVSVMLDQLDQILFHIPVAVGAADALRACLFLSNGNVRHHHALDSWHADAWIHADISETYIQKSANKEEIVYGNYDAFTGNTLTTTPRLLHWCIMVQE